MIDETALIHRRVGDLLASMREQRTDLEDILFVAIICDYCGAVAEVPAYLPECWAWLLRDWFLASERPYEDLCPGCAS
jgi:hypothetical protein